MLRYTFSLSVTIEATETRIDNNLDQGNCINRIIYECFVTTATLKKLNLFSPFHLRKQLIESLVLTKLDYYNILFTKKRKRLLVALHAINTGTKFLGHLKLTQSSRRKEFRINTYLKKTVKKFLKHPIMFAQKSSFQCSERNQLSFSMKGQLSEQFVWMN